jgi:hypothetical protein
MLFLQLNLGSFDVQEVIVLVVQEIPLAIDIIC